VSGSAFHATDARTELQLANIDVKDFISASQQFVPDDAQHLADVAVVTRTCV
jgi:hypothetical protein